MNNKYNGQAEGHPGAATDKDDGRVDKSRRRLVSAGAAIPAVMTLSPGTVAASSFMECVRNTDDSGVAQHTGAEDRWARSPVTGFWVKRVDSAASGAEQMVLLVQYSDYCVDTQNRRFTPTFDGFYLDPAGLKYKPASLEEQRYTLVYVNDQGEILGTEPSSSNFGTAVMKSCWSSVAASGGKDWW